MRKKTPINWKQLALKHSAGYLQYKHKCEELEKRLNSLKGLTQDIQTENNYLKTQNKVMNDELMFYYEEERRLDEIEDEIDNDKFDDDDKDDENWL